MGCKKQSAIFIGPSPTAQIPTPSLKPSLKPSLTASLKPSLTQSPIPSQTQSQWQTVNHRTDHEPAWRFGANGSGKFPAWADCPLSLVYLAAFRGKLSAFANMLTICERCGNYTWTLAWILLCAKTYFALSPLG